MADFDEGLEIANEWAVKTPPFNDDEVENDKYSSSPHLINALCKLSYEFLALYRQNQKLLIENNRLKRRMNMQGKEKQS